MAQVKINPRRGLFADDFIFFSLNDRTYQQFDSHFHDFYKIIIFVSGKVTYLIEGKSYHLQPWDILLVTGKDIHKPVIDPEVPYERYAIWFKPSFLMKHSLPGNNLLTCFENASERKQHLLRLQPETVQHIQYILSELDSANTSSAFGSKVAKTAFFLLLTVELNRLAAEVTGLAQWEEKDELISKIIEDIQSRLSDDLSIDSLADKYFISKYSLMHKFKQQTGFSIHNFILQKRLLTIHELIKKGYPYMEASSKCGFSDYSCFVRAFTKYFGLSPRKYYDQVRSLE